MFVASLLCSLATCAAPLPHDPGLSSLRIVQQADAIVVHAAFANADFQMASALDQNGDAAIDAAELARGEVAVRKLAISGFLLRSPAGSASATTVTSTLAENADVELTLTFLRPADQAALAVEFLSLLSRGHRSYAAVLAGPDLSGADILVDALLSPGARELALPVSFAPAAGFGQAFEFFLLGIEHILIGFDHLAFLLALLAVGVTLRRAAATITAFTLAHSVTLIAAARGLVHLPGAFVEATIAASIVWVATANLLRRRGSSPHRWPLAFGFGLVHGFGFASVLGDLDIGGADKVTPLLTFNLGVEVGQLAFAAVVVPLLWLVARHPRGRHLPAVLSVGVGLAGLFWFVERIL